MATNSQYALLRQRRFGPFFATQFLGAFNDNVFKNALILLIAFQATSLTTSTDTLINLSAGLFILPFFLFSATAGQIADKYEKAFLIRKVKVLEIVIMGLAVIGFVFQHIPLLLGVLFLMGTQSTFFGPIKYSILPQHLHDEELVGGNGLVEMGTFVAILLGTIGAGVLMGIGEAGLQGVSVSVVVVALFGYLTSRGIPAALPADPSLKVNPNPFTETWRCLAFTREKRTVFLSILGISWFWFFGAMVLTQLPNYVKNDLGGNEQVVTLLLTLLSLGIGLGSLLCERLSGHKVEIGLVPFGSIGMTIFTLDLFFAQVPLPASGFVGFAPFVQTPGAWRVMVDILVVGLFGGFFTVPLYAMVQQRSNPQHLSRIIAGNNILNALFMVGASVLAIILLGAGVTIPQLFLVLAVLNAGVAIYIYTLVPEFLMRFLVWILIHLLYRIKKEGLAHIPDKGAAVLVCNHVSYVDALIIGGCCHRPVRFVMDHRIFQVPVINFIFRTARAIPIAPAHEDAERLRQAFEEIDAALAAGDVVCIFPEGKITRDGEMNPFRRGVERILASNPVPAIPMALRGLWGSLFSFERGKVIFKWPRKLWFKVTLAVGPPLSPEEARAERLEEQVMALRDAGVEAP